VEINIEYKKMNIKIRILGILVLTSITYTFSVNGQSVEWRKKAHEAVNAAVPIAEKDPTRPRSTFVLLHSG
jgi:hypothetical protein